MTDITQIPNTRAQDLVLPNKVLTAKIAPTSLIYAKLKADELGDQFAQLGNWSKFYDHNKAYKGMRSAADHGFFNQDISEAIKASPQCRSQIAKISALEAPLGRVTLCAQLHSSPQNMPLFNALHQSLSKTADTKTYTATDTLDDLLRDSPDSEHLVLQALEKNCHTMFETLLDSPYHIAKTDLGQDELPIKRGISSLLVSLTHYAGDHRLSSAAASLAKNDFLRYLELSLRESERGIYNKKTKKYQPLSRAVVMSNLLARLDKRQAFWQNEFRCVQSPVGKVGQDTLRQASNAMQAINADIMNKVQQVVPLINRLSITQLFHLLDEYQDLNASELSKILQFATGFADKVMIDQDFRCLSALTKNQQTSLLKQMLEVNTAFFDEQGMQIQQVRDPMPIAQALLAGAQQSVHHTTQTCSSIKQTNLLNWIVYDGLKQKQLSTQDSDRTKLDQKITATLPLHNVDRLDLLSIFRQHLALSDTDKGTLFSQMNNSDWRQNYSKTIAAASGRLYGITVIDQKSKALQQLLLPRFPSFNFSLRQQIESATLANVHQVHRVMDNQLVRLSKTLPHVNDPRRKNAYSPVVLSRAYSVQQGVSVRQAFIDDGFSCNLEASMKDRLVNDKRQQMCTSELYQYLVSPSVALIDNVNDSVALTAEQQVRLSALDALLRETVDLKDLATFVSSNIADATSAGADHAPGLVPSWNKLKTAINQADSDDCLWQVSSAQWQSTVFPALKDCVQQLLQQCPYETNAGHLLNNAIRSEIADYITAFNNAGANHNLSLAGLVQESITVETLAAQQQHTLSVLERGIVDLQSSLLLNLTHLARTRTSNQSEVTQQAVDALVQNITKSASFAQLQASPLLALARGVAQEILQCYITTLAIEIRAFEDRHPHLFTLNACVDLVHNLKATIALHDSVSNQRLGAVDRLHHSLQESAQQLAEQLSNLRQFKKLDQPLWQVHAYEAKLQRLSAQLMVTFDATLQADCRSVFFNSLCTMAPEQSLLLKPSGAQDVHGIHLNMDYCYYIDDVHDLLQEMIIQRTQNSTKANTVHLAEPVLQFENKKTKAGLSDIISQWMIAKPFNQLLIVPFMPDEQQQGAQTILHWMGLVASANQKGEINCAFLDSLKHGQVLDKQQSWQQKLTEVLHRQHVPFEFKHINLQQQHNGTLCGPLLCHGLDQILQHWHSNADDSSLPSQILEKKSQDIRYEQLKLLQAREHRVGAVGHSHEAPRLERSSFIYRQHFNFA
mgnify:CR=1 FL=1